MSDRRPLRRRLLGVPLFHKILVANAVIVLVVSLIAAWMAFQAVERGVALAPLMALVGAGVLGSIGVNAFIIHLALEPLRLLERTADRIQEHDLDARVPPSALADRDLERVTAAVNGMLDRLADYRTRLRQVAARALRAGEEERRRISHELHDETSQRLAAILMRLRIARSLRDGAAKDVMLQELRRDLAETADALRRYAQGLRPPALEELGLAAALASHVRLVNSGSCLPVELEVREVGRLESPDAELAVYRILQEAIANAVRHSRAQRVRVAVERENGLVSASVSDDGVGFDVARLLGSRDGTRGLGLFGMLERAEYVGGRVEVLSREGGGTTVRLAVPAGGPGAPLPPPSAWGVPRHAAASPDPDTAAIPVP